MDRWMTTWCDTITIAGNLEGGPNMTDIYGLGTGFPLIFSLVQYRSL